MTAEKSSRRNFWQIVALFAVLVILPAGSWYYLKRGADFRRAQLAELSDFGKVKWYKFKDWTPQVTADSLDERVLILGFFDGNDTPGIDTIQQQATLLQLQFGARNDFRILMFEVSEDSITGQSASERIISDIPVWKTTAPTLTMLGFQIDFKSLETQPGWALIDQKGTIRRYYPAGDLEKLITHAAIIAPGKSREKIDLKRQMEK